MQAHLHGWGCSLLYRIAVLSCPFSPGAIESCGMSVSEPRLISVGSVPSDPRWAMPSHVHRCHELIAVNRGSIHVRFADGRITGQAGDVLFYCAGAWHEEWSEPGDPAETYFVSFQWPDLGAGESRCVRDRSGRVRRMVQWLYQEWPEHAVATGRLCTLYLRSILEEWRLAAERTEDEMVRQVRAYMRLHIHEHVVLDDLAAEAGLSRFHFVRTYGRLSGRTPMADLRAERVRHAQGLLVNTGLPLKAVAAEAGMCDEQHLSRLFRRYLNTTPGETRAGLTRSGQAG